MHHCNCMTEMNKLPSLSLQLNRIVEEMQPQKNNHPIVKGNSKPLSFSHSSESIVVGEDSNQMLLINKHDPSQHFRISTGKTDKTVGLKLTDKLLVRAGIQGTVTLWDTRVLGTSNSIHTFNRPGCKFSALDVSEHILAGGASKRVVFWDLRKMKQRSEFTESFNEDVTCLQFSKQIPTIFYATTYDGLIAKFDLTQKNEEDAFMWGHQIVQSPCYLENSGSFTLIQTQDQHLLTLQEESLKENYAVSSIDNPRHILSSYLTPQRKVSYYTRSMKKDTVEFWTDKTQLGYLPTHIPIEMLIPIGEGRVVYSDEMGNWYYDQVIKGRLHQKQEQNKDFCTVEQLQGKQLSKQVNKNGFIVNKPSSLKNSHKKFKPY